MRLPKKEFLEAVHKAERHKSYSYKQCELQIKYDYLSGARVVVFGGVMFLIDSENRPLFLG